MTKIVDTRKLTAEQCEAIAARIRVAKDFELPKLRFWNYQNCRKHRFGWEDSDGKTVTDKPKPGCQNCGIHFRKHQRVGLTWLYFKKRALLADSVGTGKTSMAAGLTALLKETGELTQDARVLICVRPAAIGQWARELNRMIPTLNVITASGSRKSRFDTYMQPWDVCLIGPQVLLNDEVIFDSFSLCLLIVDDIDALRHFDTKTACAVKRIGRRAPRMVIMSGTPLQKRLHELHSVLDPLGGLNIYGSRTRFEKRYVIVEIVKLRARGGRIVTKKEIVGYRNISEFSSLMAPLALRRTADDIDDVELPAIMPPNNVFLDLYPRQREKYDQLRTGLVEVIKKGNVSRMKAASSLHTGAQICGGLSLLGEEDGEGASVKLDWVMEQLTGDLADEKVVVFIYYKDGVRSLEKRLIDAGIGHGIIWGEDANKDSREATRNRFWNDPACKVLIGTTAIEQSLNLQCARHIICFDSILNPARMEQVVGRIRRDGSAFKSIYVHNLFTNNTQEARYLSLLENEQALIDSVWDENSALFKSLDPMKLMSLIVS